MSSLQLPGFEILEQRGQGGMATVWKARQISLNRIVAIKILNTRLARDEGDVERFQAEAQSAARLKHTGIVQVYDARAEQGLYYFVMEYVEGGTAGEWVRRRGVLPEKDTVLLADCVADALEYAWNKERIIHCDIKPDNIMIDADGTVKVADLGLARSITAMARGDEPQEIHGTPAYISPEQSRGAAALDFRSDIYSLGATVYHLLTGHMLFEGQPDARVMDLQITSSVDDPLDSNPRLSKGVCWLLERMLAKDPALRQQSWSAVRADIERVKKGLPPRVKGFPAGCSTIRRSARRTKADYAVSRRFYRDDSDGGQRLLRVGGVLLLFALVSLAAWWLIKGQVGRTLFGRAAREARGVNPAELVLEEPPRPNPPPHRPAGGTLPGTASADARAAAMLDAARRWSEEHPEDFEEARLMFVKVAAEASGTSYATLAQSEALRLASARDEAVSQVMEALKVEATPLIDGSKFDEAIDLYEGYRGRFAGLTVPQRDKAVRAMRALRAEREQALMRQQWVRDKALRAAIDAIVTELLAGRTAAGVELVDKAIANGRLSARQEDFRRLKAVLSKIANSEAVIAESFRSQTGKEITVQLNSGPIKVRIQDVKDRTVTALESRTVGTAVATRRVTFTLDDLTPSELLARMGADEDKAASLAKGLLAVNARAWAVARNCFEGTDPLISRSLLQRVEELQGVPQPAPPE